MLYPETLLELGFQSKFTLCDGWVPVPLRLTSAGEFVASLTNETCPVELPAACGAKVTVNGTLCPADTVTGNVIPLNANPPPLHEAEETVTFEDPAVRFAFSDWLPPTATLPKLMVELLTAS
jgi:hypothetical protein